MKAIEAVCTVCSREKSKVPGLIPASERYVGAHVGQVAMLARSQSLPLYLVSGLIGFIPAECKVPDYDHLLQNSDVKELARRMFHQMRVSGIKKLHFYCKGKESWQPYLSAVLWAALCNPVHLNLIPLEDEVHPMLAAMH